MNNVFYNVLIYLSESSEPFVWCWFCSRIAVKNEKRIKFSKIAIVLLCVFIVMKNLLKDYLGEMNVLSFGINNTYMIAYYYYAILFYEVDKKVVFGCISIQYIASALLEYMYSFATIIVIQCFSVTAAMEPSLVRVLSMVLMESTSAAILVVFTKLRIEYRDAMSHRNVFQLLVLVLVADIITFSVFCCVSDNQMSDVFNIGTATVLICESVMLIYAIYLIVKDSRKEREYLETIKFTQNYIEMLNETQKNIDESQKVLHDVTNHLYTIGAMAEKHMYSEIYAYIQKLVPELKNARIGDVGNSILSVVLYEKKVQANRANIELMCGIDVEDINIPVVELNSIITNIMDNAIEACKKIKNRKKRKITFKVYIEQDDLVIECINTYAGNPQITKDGDFTTTKKDSIHHGYGLKRINEYVEQNGGDVNICFGGGIFKIKILLDKKIAIHGGN